jgi:hypothetical protein
MYLEKVCECIPVGFAPLTGNRGWVCHPSQRALASDCSLPTIQKSLAIQIR